MWGPIEDVRPGSSRAAPSLIQPPPEQPDLTLIGKHRDQPALRCQHSHRRRAGGLLLLCVCAGLCTALHLFILHLFPDCRVTLADRLDAPQVLGEELGFGFVLFSRTIRELLSFRLRCVYV